ncbi:hypothetical protein HU200_002236 [Digitaria exilis]|uniref:Uncharacterized protein n=1 Tax=Digitaria exilis TaxID=1010633 RepID=A0A835KX42_9POAL|nr:hypothetical protein HU200_002236 [Digitaria exilis]
MWPHHTSTYGHPRPPAARTAAQHPKHHRHTKLAMELLLLPSRAASARLLPPTSPVALRRAGTARPASSSSNVEVIEEATAASTSAPGGAWRAGGLGLGLELSEEMRRGMAWRMLAPPAAAVAADAAFLRLLDRAAPGDAPAWAAAAGSALLFAAGLLGVHYGFLSSRWDASERGSVLGWDLAVRHWNVLSMTKEHSSSVEDEEEDDEEYEDEEEYEDDDELDDDY